MINDHRYTDPEALAEALANSLAVTLRKALTDRDRASLVVSGGSTPTPLFRALSRIELPWQRVDVLLADERWVAPEHQASNERLVRSELLRENAAQARLIGFDTSAATPAEGCAVSSRSITELRPFDIVVLGMGVDGHTASLFPDLAKPSAALDPESTETCAVVHTDSSAWVRLTLTLAALTDCRRLVLHVTGDAKRRVLDTVLNAGTNDPRPIRAVLDHAPARGVDVYWSP